MNRSDKLSKLPIEKRLMSVFRIISLLLSATGIIACVAMGIVSYQYSYALRHYGFAQGDIGKAMIVIAEMRSCRLYTSLFSSDNAVSRQGILASTT